MLGGELCCYSSEHKINVRAWYPFFIAVLQTLSGAPTEAFKIVVARRIGIIRLRE